MKAARDILWVAVLLGAAGAAVSGEPTEGQWQALAVARPRRMRSGT